MKLYECEGVGVDYDPRGYIVANTEEEAVKEFKFNLDENDIWHAGTVVAYEVKVKGYKILVEPE